MVMAMVKSYGSGKGHDVDSVVRLPCSNKKEEWKPESTLAVESRYLLVRGPWTIFLRAFTSMLESWTVQSQVPHMTVRWSDALQQQLVMIVVVAAWGWCAFIIWTPKMVVWHACGGR